MSVSNMNKTQRITLKRKQPNPLFQYWLEQLLTEAEKCNSKREPMLREALESLSKYPLPLKTGMECAVLKGFNIKLCLYLDKILKAHRNCDIETCVTGQYEREPHETVCKQFKPDNHNQFEPGKSVSKGSTQTSPQNEIIDLENSLPNDDKQFNGLISIHGNRSPPNDPQINMPSISSQKHNQKTSRKKLHSRIYKPAFRSGAFAILIALLKHKQENPLDSGLTKDELQEKAQEHSEESFFRCKPGTFYTAWSNVTRLISKGLVHKHKKRKCVYALTEEGILLATELYDDYKTRPSVNDVIFNSPMLSSSQKSPDTNVEEEKNNYDPGPSHFVKSNCNKADSSVIELPAGTFEVILLIDKNETGGVSKKNDPTVAQFNKYADLKHEYRSLKVGDFTWVVRHKIDKDKELVLPYVAERKRMDDLGNSIKDGRFHEQKFRLRRCGLKNVIYLVENYGTNKHVGLPLQSLMQALANTRVQDGFKVHMTNSLSNTARFLAMMTKRLTMEFKNKHLKGHHSEPIDGALMTFQYFNKASSKTKPLTVTETFIKLLLQLKGVSVEKALTITNNYKTPTSLMEAYAKHNPKDGEMLLCNLKYGDTARNVGRKISKTIYQLFTQRVLA